MMKIILKKIHPPLILFASILLLNIFLHIVLLQKNVWPMNGDEAQYWDWAKHLAFGYYSKPPFIAWIIAVTTKIFGNSILGIRIGSIICHTITSLFIYLSARFLFDEKTGFYAGLIYILSPGVIFSAGIISTDAPLLMFWAMTFYGLLRAKEKNLTIWWMFTGVTLGFALLSKYAAIIFPLSIFIYAWLNQSEREIVKNPKFYLALFIAFLLLLPNIIWNVQHHYSSVHAVADNANLHGLHLHGTQLLAFFLSQLALIGPIFFVIFIMIICNLSYQKTDNRIHLLLVFSIPLFCVMLTEALISRAHANWSAPVYITGVIAIAALLVSRNMMKWLVAGLVMNILIYVGFFYIDEIILISHIKLPPKMTTLHWQDIGEEIKNTENQYKNISVIVDDRMLLTLTRFYSGTPLEKMYEWNPSGVINDQYDLVTHLNSQENQNFLLVTYRQNPQDILQRFKFSHLEKSIKEKTLDGREQEIYIYYLQDFVGY